MINREVFFAEVRPKLFGGSLSRQEVQCLDALLDVWGEDGSDDLNQLAYVMAVAHHESGVYKYTHELWGPTAAQRGYEGRKDLGNTVKGDGYKYRGRGFVCQLTGRRNYGVLGKLLGLDLIGNPDLAAGLKVAAKIGVVGSLKGLFTGKKLSDYISGSKVDFVGARRVINGTDKAATIAGYARVYAAALKKAAVGRLPEPAPVPVPAPIEELQKPLVAQKSVLERVGQIGVAVGGVTGAIAGLDWKVVLILALVGAGFAVWGLWRHKGTSDAAKEIIAEIRP